MHNVAGKSFYMPPKITPEMLEIGRPPRLEDAWRHWSARKARGLCCQWLHAILDERFPKRVAWPRELAARTERLRGEFYDEVAFLFDVAIFQGLQEEPTQSVYNAFLKLLESDQVINVLDIHEPWEEWYAVHFGDYEIHKLFDTEHAATVNSNNDPATTAMFYRAYELLRRINDIENRRADPITTNIMDIMPEEIRFSLVGSSSYESAPAKETGQEKVTYQRPWLLVTEEYVVYRYRLADELGLSDKALSNYEKAGSTTKGTPWPSPLNPRDTHSKKYYDPLKVLDTLTKLPKDFSKNIPIDDIIAKLMNNKLASKITIKTNSSEAKAE